MFKKSFIIGLLCLIFQTSYAQDQNPLRIAVPHFIPPFVIEGYNKKLSGFDIIFMSHLCEDIGRQCIFMPMATEEILPAIANNQADVGIGSITITLDRYKYTNFTIPYMLSESRFLIKNSRKNYRLDLKEIKNKNIGVQNGTIHEQELRLMDIDPSHITSFININDVIDALNNNNIDLAFISNPIAIYWENYSAGTLHTLDKPIGYGLGIGIAVNKNLPEVNKALDAAILLFQQTLEYQQIYQMYFGTI